MKTASVRVGTDKENAQAQWDQDPCGAHYVKDHALGTREFFDSVEQYRYNDYAPWLPQVMGFNEFGGRNLLEIGCGMGSDLLQFARGKARCTAVDLTPRSIEITRHRFALYGEKGSFMISDAEDLPFPSETFDVVYSNGVLHHLDNTEAAVDEVHRVLKKGGIAKVMLYHRNSLNYWLEIVLRRGLFGGEYLRGRSSEQIMSRVVEYSGHEARPVVKVYSRKQAAKLFHEFSDVTIEVNQLLRSEMRFLNSLTPESLFRFLQKHIGWNVIITARK